MPNTEDREVVVRFDPAKGLYFRELRPKRKLCPKCSQIPLAFFVGPGLEGGVGFLNLITSMPSNTYEDIPIIHIAAFGHDFSNSANFKHLSYRDVKQSAKNGCHLCTLVVRSFESGEQSAFTPMDDMGEGFIVLTHQVRRFPFGSKWDAIVPILGRGSHSGPIAAVGLYLRIMIAEVPGCEDVIEDDPASEASLEMVRDMLEDCAENHPDCKPDTASASFCPTRLLSVGGSESDKVKLIETSNATLDDRRYLALSHCWGLTKMITTTTATLKSRLADIDETTLPKTFQDVIRLARSIKVPYVWIDSLCIIQDSPADWDKEASLMGRVYSSAYCTMAAAASPDGNGGLFVERNHLETQICDIFNFPNEAPANLYTEEEEDSHPDAVINVFPPRPSWEKLIEQGILSTRGWTLQERLLSPRVVHFTNGETVWECRTAQRSEVDYHMGGLAAGSVAMTDSSRIFDKRPFKTEVVDFERWYRLVNLYTRRSFTKDQDRLAALSGLAQEVQQKLGWHYFAGLWEEDMVRGLAWSPNRSPGTKHYRPQTYRAPSWSWASIEGPIKFPSSSKEETKDETKTEPDGTQLRVVSISVVPFRSDPYGMLKAGCLTVRGAILVAAVQKGSLVLPQDPQKRNVKAGSSWSKFHHRIRRRKKGGQSTPRHPQEPDAGKGSLGELEFDIPGESQDQDVYLLQVCFGNKPLAFCDAMALQRESSGRFRRIGWATRISKEAFEACGYVEIEIE